MTVPKTIHAGPYKYSVSERDIDGDDSNGMTNRDQLTVVIEPYLPARRKAMVVLHECLHIIWDLAGIDDSVDEEQVVTRMAPHLLALLRRNPKLVAYLTGAP